MIIMSTSTTRPCSRCGAKVTPRHRRIMDDPRSPLCDACVDAAGLVQVDAVLASAAAIEIRLDTARDDPIMLDELVRLREPVCRNALTLAEQQLGADHGERS